MTWGSKECRKGQRQGGEEAGAVAAGTKQGSLSGFPGLEGPTDGSSMRLMLLSATHLLFKGFQQLMGSNPAACAPFLLVS